MHDAVAFLLGRWNGSERIADSRWGKGGDATATVSVRSDLGGKVLVMDYAGLRADGPSISAHAVITTGPEHDQFNLFWFDNFGFVPSAPAPGHWNGERLVFLRTSLRGQTRHIYVPVNGNAFELTLESSMDNGLSWEPVMHGRYLRA